MSLDWNLPAEPGDRVRIIHFGDDTVNGVQVSDLGPGDEGTVTFVDGFGTVHVKWDRGGNLGLIPGEDQWENLGKPLDIDALSL